MLSCRLCPVVLGAALLGAVVPASAYDVFLDHNTDGLIFTFDNSVTGPVSVPVDIVVEIGAADVGLTSVQVLLGWGYGGSSGEPGCFDVYGSVSYVPDQPLPGAAPFVNVVPTTCVCFGRCFCDAQLLINADISGIASPGLYRLATLDFSRVGFSDDCTAPTYPVSTFTTYSTDPRGTLVIRDEATGAEDGVEASNWGRIKALYRE
jgi:hypothetical protein